MVKMSGPEVDFSSNGRIRSTPTLYGGVTFRSQLEARWARFFDLVGVQWKYEPQGFAILVRMDGAVVDAITYLPDFLIGTYKNSWWLEIKGREPTDQELVKCQSLALSTNMPVGLIRGGFWDEPKVWTWDGGYDPFGLVWRWLKGGRLTGGELSRISTAYRTSIQTNFAKAREAPNRRPGQLQYIVANLKSRT